jgi:putative hydrolase of the HAD superfamily
VSAPGAGALAAQLRDWSRPLTPLPAAHPARPATLSNIRAVVFDVYGTMFISASGALGEQPPLTDESEFHARLATVGIGLLAPPSGLAATLAAAIQQEHRRLHARGCQFPEVDIREIWRQLLPAQPAADIPIIALAWETTVNPVWPMPGLAATLQALRDRPLLLGIVSNAQFFTPLLFEAFLGCSAADLGFHRALCRWSYREGHAKPGARLFELLATGLEHLDLTRGEVLVVGNDMRNDIQPAAACGFQTALFGGDGRSLRLRSLAPPAPLLGSLAELPGLLG